MSSLNNFYAEMENWVNLYLFRSLSEYFDYLKTTDVSMPQAYVLTFIHYNGPSKISDICEHMMVTAAAASQMVDESLVKQSIEARRSWIKEIPEDLSEGQLDQISAALKLLTSIYQE
jgi:DNA-binding MarR family transcriptional regulator